MGWLGVNWCRYIIQGEKLDGFMRHVQAQQALLDEGKLILNSNFDCDIISIAHSLGKMKIVGQQGRVDDSAAKNIVQMVWREWRMKNVVWSSTIVPVRLQSETRTIASVHLRCLSQLEEVIAIGDN